MTEQLTPRPNPSAPKIASNGRQEQTGDSTLIDMVTAERSNPSGSQPKATRFVVPVLGGLLVLVLGAGALMLMGLQSDLTQVKTQQISAAKSQGQMQAQIQAVTGARGSGGTDLSKMQTQIDELSSKLIDTESKLAKVCDSGTISSQIANINGQQTADTNGSYTYYSNMTQTINSICGTSN